MLISLVILSCDVLSSATEYRFRRLLVSQTCIMFVPLDTQGNLVEQLTNDITTRSQGCA